MEFVDSVRTGNQRYNTAFEFHKLINLDDRNVLVVIHNIQKASEV